MKTLLAGKFVKHSALTLCASTILLLASSAQAEQRPLLTLHVPETVASGIAPLVGHVPASERFSLAISLPLRNEAQLDNLLQRLYDPQDPSFHKYLSVGEFVANFGPQLSDYMAVVQFARSNDLTIIDAPANRLDIIRGLTTLNRESEAQ